MLKFSWKATREIVTPIVLAACFGFFIPIAIASVIAQDPGVVQPAAPDQAKKIADLEQRLAQLQQQAQPSQEQLVKQAQVGYTAIFKEAKEKAQPGCKAAGGRLRVTVAPDGKASVSCEW